VPYQEHSRQSNDEILLSVMTEDDKGINDIEKIAALDGIDLVSIGPSDLSQALGVTDPKDPKLMAKVTEMANQVKAIGKAKLQFPMNHNSCPLTPTQLVELGVGYTHVGPPPPGILLRHRSESLKKIHEELGR